MCLSILLCTTKTVMIFRHPPDSLIIAQMTSVGGKGEMGTVSEI